MALFVALTPIYRFGMGQVQDAYYSCDNHGCEIEDYYADVDSDWCDTCREPRVFGVSVVSNEKARAKVVRIGDVLQIRHAPNEYAGQLLKHAVLVSKA